MPLNPKPNCTIDTNCIIALDERRAYASAISDLISMHDAGQITLRVAGISASEKQKDGKMAPNFALFKDRLARLGLGAAAIIAPPGYWDFTYMDNSFYSVASYTLLELEIHKVLWSDKPFYFHEFEATADKTKPGWDWKWKNPKCDTLAFMGHVLAGSGLFVSDDSIFHGEKKAELIKFAGGDIAKPMEAVARLNDPAPFAQMPAAVADFLANPTDQIDPASVPAEFERIQAVKKINDERAQQQNASR